MIRIAVVDDDKVILCKIKELIEKEIIDEVSIDLFSYRISRY